MQEKSITLTPNNRLARQLQKQYCPAQVAAFKRNTWHTPTILPLGTWLKNCWYACSDPRTLLDKQQEKLLWQKIIRKNLGGEFNGLATLAAKSHELINNWGIAAAHKDNCATENIIIFQRIRSEFLEYCKSNNLVTTSELLTLIAPHVSSYNFTKITFAGFDEYPPQLQALITTIKNSGCEICEIDPNNRQSFNQKLLGFDNLTQEIITSAKWAKKIIANHPNTTIGIIVPNLITLRPKIQQIFTEVFYDTDQIKCEGYINISAGILLNSIPIINSALELLATSEPPPPIIRHPSEWAQLFGITLQALGWPGESNLTDLETTAIQGFTKAIQQFAATDFIWGRVSYKNALQTLHEFINNTTLHPEPETNALINVLGTFEATGINFDHLWVMGVDQENWPPAPQPNPFIPIVIQKKLFLPHSSAERELHFAKILLDRYKRSTEAIVFSYVKQQEGLLTSPSTLISDIPETSVDDLDLEQTLSFAQKIYFSKKLEILENDHAPQLTPNETLTAGSRLLELQSLCPFRAFMEFRLATREPQKPTLGVSKIARGILIHSALENIWHKVKTQQELCSLEPLQLQKLIIKSIESALIQAAIPSPLYKLEKQCLTLLISKWLAIEKARPPFQVLSTEKSVQINLSSIQLKLRIDRIDQLANGDMLLIDYKTGKSIPSIFDWFGARPKAPQLLLYSLAIDQAQGFALAQINIESLKFKDVGINELIVGFNTVSPGENNITWNELKNYWQDTLTKIADDFVAGKAFATPLSPQVCKQCGFKSVCRI